MYKNIMAKWIWKNNDIKVNDFAYFRKSFNLEGIVKEAKLLVSAHNYYKLFLNGKEISGKMSPVSSNPFKSKYYLEYDIKDALVQGINVIGSIVHYLGGYGQNYVNASPGFILEARIDLENKDTIEVITDNTWKCLNDTPYENGTPYQQRRRLSAVEIYDMRKEPKLWLSKDFDDSKWDYSVVVNNNYIMKKQELPEGCVGEEITPICMDMQQPGCQVFDAGKIVSGWVKIILNETGKEGFRIRIRYSEDLEEGRVKHNVCNEKSEFYYDEYIMSNDPIQIFKADFSYKAFRYFEITGYDEIISPKQIVVENAYTSLDYRGEFNCSIELLNEIYQACIQTQRNNTLGQLVDCPHREQAQYLADSDLQLETLCYNFLNPEILSKVLQDFADGQLEDGTFPYVYPINYSPKGFYKKIPEWDLHYVKILWKAYYLYNNKEVLKNYYPTAKKMILYFIGKIDETGLIPKSEYWHISDWPRPKVCHEGSYLTVQNCKAFHCLSLMTKIAGILGNKEDEIKFNKTAEDLRIAIVRNLYDKEQNVFVDSFSQDSNKYTGQNASQAANVVAFYYGIADILNDHERKSILNHILNEGHTCQTLLSVDLLRLLFENGFGKEAFSLINKETYPSWGYMISKGYKTIWEGFDDESSHCHAWNAYPARILQEYILGIKAMKEGFDKVLISPYIPEEMNFAEGKIATVKGDIYVKWQKCDDKINITVNLPIGTEGTISIDNSNIEITKGITNINLSRF
ncbi:MAG: family 78 glycoside hydrolase catalytic domain [Clostridiaceae bacterium]|nr:family 78 glycoside hydrolase catalytic domain [Clostridiaceae bacterium]